MIPSRVQLSNRDKLILRKQALKMKNRPVLAVGDVLSPVPFFCILFEVGVYGISIRLLNMILGIQSFNVLFIDCENLNMESCCQQGKITS